MASSTYCLVTFPPKVGLWFCPLGALMLIQIQSICCPCFFILKYYQNQPQLDNNTPDSLMQNQNRIQTFMPKTLAANKDYQAKAEDLFRTNEKLNISQKHLAHNIVTNPKTLFNLIESNFFIQLRQDNPLLHFQLKTEVLAYIKFLIEDFPLNAKFFYEDAFLVVQNNSRTNFVSYLIKDMGEANILLRQTSKQQQKQIYIHYLTASTTIFYLICSICTLRTSELKLITNTLTQFYYEEKLSVPLIGHCFRLLDAGLQERNITPYLYFIDNNKNDSVKVLFTNNKWPFAKGMTLFMWITALKLVDCRLFWLKTEDSNELLIKIINGKMVVCCFNQQSKEDNSTQICEFPINTIVSIAIQLEPVNEGLFKSTAYLLNIKVNGVQYKNITSKIPKFESNEFVTQFSLLNGFIGNLYSIVITAKPELQAANDLNTFSQFGICRQKLVWDLIDKKVLKNESILCIFNSQRYFQGLLLNYVYEKNQACFQGRVSSVKYHKYDSKIIQIYLPFLYFLTLIKEKNQQWVQLFDLVLQHILQIIGKQHYEIESVLLLLFFLETNQYRISQSTLNCLYDSCRQHQNFYLNIVVKYLDVHALIGKGLNIDQSIQPYQNPVDKIIFLFHLETSWSKKWNQLQGFEGWWSPFFFQSQYNHPYNPDDFVYDPKRQSRVQWSVMNLVTKDYCKCLIEPIFIIPKYGILSKFQQQYVRKQCFMQEFKLKLYHPNKGETLICNKISNSGFDRIKNKLLGVAQKIESPKKKNMTSQIKQFQSECVYIDILTIVEGIVRITRDGYVVFTSRHRNKKFDHMCVKGYKHQQFFYLSIPFCDIHKIYKKRFNATNNALEIKTNDGRQIMLHFYLRNVDDFISVIQGSIKVKKDAYSNYINAHKPVQWIDKQISNYQYLQWLNEIAGRSYCDMTQYPVLPWVFVSSSEKLGEDHNSTKAYRDLNKNMGLQGDQQRIRHFMDKYQNLDEENLFNQYHFGTHYSSSAIIFNFLIRVRPYSIGAMVLQSGKFDVADRLFYSYWGSWNNATTSPTDVRELIPEIYTLPQMFINKNNYDYGLTQDKIPIDNVQLPLWANRNPYLFVSQIRSRLESSHVSERINQWIDLIYGYKQRGKDAVENMNIFYPLTYENCIDLSQVEDPNQLESFETQIAHFGQNPSQIIGNNPHPKRLATKAHWEDKLMGDANQLIIQRCSLSRSPVTEQKNIFKSVFESRNSILGIKFVSNDLFFVLRKHEYYLFQILSKQANSLSKEQEVAYQIQSIQASLNYKELSTFVPIAAVNDQLAIVGGFYNGNAQIIFFKQSKYNRVFKFPCSTITALAYHSSYHLLYVGDSQGYLRVYQVTIQARQIEFEEKRLIKAHDSKINDIILNQGANLAITCSDDGALSLFNSYSLDIVRTIRHPNGLPIHFAHISTNPLYAVAFYSKQNSTVYIYSINGQLLDSFCEKTGFIYNMSVLKASNSTQSLVYLNSHRELYVWSLPYLQLKRKIKLKKDEFRISCFQSCHNSKIGVAGTQDGGLQIIANPASY